VSSEHAHLTLAACGLAAAALVAAVAAVAPAASAADRLVLLDGRTLEATVASIDAKGRVRMANGALAVDLEGLRRIDRPVQPKDDAGQAPCEVFLLAGDAIQARDVVFDGSTFVVDASFGTGLSVPLAAVSAVRLGRRADGDFSEPPEFLAARTGADTRRDQLFAVVDGRIQVVHGALQRIDPTEVGFIWDDAERRVARSKVYGVVLARTAAAPDVEGRCLVRLRDGSSFWMAVAGMAEGRLSGSLVDGLDVVVPWDAVVSLEVRSPRMAFLSDLDPVEADQQALVTFAGRWQRDRNVLGEPLRLGDRTYGKGLGVHSRCRLEYDLGGRYDVFAATIGLDTSAAGRGDCIFKVHADGKELFSKRMTGKDDPVEVRLPVAGATRLTLAVEWGEDLDLADLADWCDARVLKEAPK